MYKVRGPADALGTHDKALPTMDQPLLGKLRHISLSVKDIEETARFYEQAFGMFRVRQSNVAVMMSDGVVSLAIISSTKNPNAEEREGLHHVGFLIDEMESAADRVLGAGAEYHGQINGVGKGPATERKYRDPNGVVFDIVTREHAERVWCLPQIV